MIRKNIECPYHKVKECGTHLVCNTQLNPPSFYEGREMVPPFCIKQMSLMNIYILIYVLITLLMILMVMYGLVK